MLNSSITAYEKVCTLIAFMDRKVKEDLFMASYGEDEVRFYTNDLHEPVLVERIVWTTYPSLTGTLDKLKKVTTSI